MKHFKNICAIMMVAASLLSMAVQTAEAKSVKVDKNYSSELYHMDRGDDGNFSAKPGGQWIGFKNYNIDLKYEAVLTKADNGNFISDGSPVKVGDKLKLEVIRNSDQVHFNGSGYNNDSPYGRWSDGMAAPGKEALCTGSQLFNGQNRDGEKYGDTKDAGDFGGGTDDLYALLSVDPKKPDVSWSANLKRISVSDNALNQTFEVMDEGTPWVKVVFPDTTGRFYSGKGKNNTDCAGEEWNAGRPMRSSETNVWTGNFSSALLRWDFKSTYPNRQPDNVSISGPNVAANGPSRVAVNAPFSFNVKGTDPDNGDKLKYETSYSNDAAGDSISNIGSGEVRTFTHIWSTVGTKDFKARSTDGTSYSSWVEKKVDVYLNGKCASTDPAENDAEVVKRGACLDGSEYQNADDSPTQIKWTCKGLNGGTPINCATTSIKKNAVCALKETPTSNACLVGTYSNTPDDTGANYRWTCKGINQGLDAPTCSAVIPIDAKCGATFNTCAPGDKSTIMSPTEVAGVKYSNWNCASTTGGNPISCKIKKPVCGTSLNSCAEGSASNKGDDGTNFTWDCKVDGLPDNPVSCKLNKADNTGKCSTVEVNKCVVGTPTGTGGTNNTPTQYVWGCNGLNGAPDSPACKLNRSECGSISDTQTPQTWPGNPNDNTWCRDGVQSSWTQKGDAGSNNGTWKWNCTVPGGAAKSCSFVQKCATGETLVGGICKPSAACGPLNGKASFAFPTPGADLCQPGAYLNGSKVESTNASNHAWKCTGDGADVSCSAPRCDTGKDFCPATNSCVPDGECNKPGTCGVNDGKVDVKSSNWPTSGWCGVGSSLSSVSWIQKGDDATNNGTWKWSCTPNVGGGANSKACSMTEQCAPGETLVSGVCKASVACGSLDGKASLLFPAPDADLCEPGSLLNGSKAPSTTNAAHTWKCTGTGGTVSCSAPRCGSGSKFCPAANKCIPNSESCIDPECGPLDGKASIPFPTPGADLCEPGSASAQVTGTSDNSPHAWKCLGTSPSAVSCSAPLCGAGKEFCPATNSCVPDGECNNPGTCGVNDGKVNVKSSNWPTSGWCGTGSSLSNVSWIQKGDVSNGDMWKWSCTPNVGGGKNSKVCSMTEQCAPGETLVSGVCKANVACGPLNGKASFAFPTPGADLCEPGSLLDGSKVESTNAANHTWKCEGIGNDVSCFAPRCGTGTKFCPSANACIPNAQSCNVAGKCGTALNSCDAGTFVNTGDDPDNQNWDCEGTNGGAIAHCFNKKASCGTMDGKVNQLWPTPSNPDYWCEVGNRTGSQPGSWIQKGDVSNGNRWKWGCAETVGNTSDNSCTFTQKCPAGDELINGVCTDINEAPSVPSVSGEPQGAPDTSYTFTASGADDPEGDKITYGFDWDGNGVVDKWSPASATLSSGASSNASHSWSLPLGKKNFQVLAKDSSGAVSGWKQASITLVNECLPVSVTYQLNPSIVNTSSGQCVLKWNAVNESVGGGGAICTNVITCSVDGGPSTLDSGSLPVNVGTHTLVCGDGDTQTTEYPKCVLNPEFDEF